MSLAAGTRLGPYEITAAIGAGGMGEVYEAHDRRLERTVAIKVLPAASFGDPAARARLMREARTASQLNHPNICTIHDVGEEAGHTYLAMELVQGETLRARLARGALPAEEVVRVGRQLADALGHAHAHGVVHRDFKSANIVLTPEGRAKVLDFGLAKRVSSEALAESVTGAAPTVTQPGSVAGTLAYMAPEQLRGQPADARSDVWALGVVLHEMAAGALPFQGQTSFELSSAILNDPPRPLPAAVPAELRAVIARCCEKDPAQRYASGAQVQAAFDALATGQVVPWPARPTPRASRRTLAIAGLGAAALFVLAGTLVWLDVGGVRRQLTGGGAAQTRAVRLAVLPFANLTGDPEQEYLSDGVTQEMIAQLGRLHPQSLSVVARTSVMRYKKAETPIDQIGRELNVQYVLEGSARREGSRIRISAELIQVRDQTQLWADVYERDLAGILALQSEVAQKVAGALALKLLPAEQARLANVRPVNPEAYDAYLKGSHHWVKLTPGDLEAAQRYFELALQKDPNYAPAYAGLALVWSGRNQMGLTPPSEAAPKAKAAALKAVALDDTLADSHYALACVKTWHDWDIPGAEPEWRRALELNPNFPDARAFFSHYLLMTGRPDEGVAQIKEALKLDPFSSLLLSLHAIDLLFLGRYDESIAEARNLLRLQPDAPVGLAALANAQRMKGPGAETIAAIRGYYALYGDPLVDQALAKVEVGPGYAGAMRRAAEALAARFNRAYLNPGDVADLYIDAGDKAQALDWLEKGVAARDPNMPYIGVMPQYGTLRSEPRFQALLRQMKLPLP